MALGSEGDFFGGYDHKAEAGILHVADHHIAPGKKQWTWGNHEFGYAWDRHLSDDSAPYVELMAGVFTDNQPDFSFLIPGETRSWSQFWYPIQKIGVPRNANADAAVSLNLSGRALKFGIQVNVELPNALVRLSKEKGEAIEFRFDLSPARPLLQEQNWSGNKASLSLFADDGREIISAAIGSDSLRDDPPGSAFEPPLPFEINSNEELYLVGLHLEQYRHATRSPVPYWRAALERDPLDSKCNNALGLWHMRRGEFETAETHFRKSIQRLTARNANPRDGEAFYNLGECLRFQALAESNKQTIGDAYSAFFKATWNKAWAASAYLALAEIDCCRNDFELALEHINNALDLDLNNLKSWNLRTLILRKLGDGDLAEGSLLSTLRLDSLDTCARYLAKGTLAGDLQAALDVAHDLVRAGLFSEAEELLLDHLQHSWDRRDLPDQSWGAAPLIWYTLGWIQAKQHKVDESGLSFEKGASISPDYCFPNRLEEIAVLKSAIASNSKDARAPYFLGNLFYARGRHEEAIKLWKRTARIDPDFSIPWRNSGIAEFNDHANPLAARRDYEKAFKVNPYDGRVLFELDQLAKRSGERPRKRLERLSKSIALVKERDDLSVEISRLYNLNGQPEKALEILNSRQFKPWEGGEGQALSQYVRSNLALGREFLLKQDRARALDKFQSALTPPDGLGEVAHLLANQGDIHFWIANALALLDRKKEARSHWTRAASFEGDFQQMAVTTYSEMTFYSVLSLRCLHQQARARKLAQSVFEYSVRLEREPAKIDYFATSLPDMLVFDDDFKLRKKVKALFLRAQASFCLGRKANAGRLVRKVLQLDPNHELAISFASEVAALQLLNK
jgi:tetratricopeptide (TPR) repeat protein